MCSLPIEPELAASCRPQHGADSVTPIGYGPFESAAATKKSVRSARATRSPARAGVDVVVGP